MVYSFAPSKYRHYINGYKFISHRNITEKFFIYQEFFSRTLAVQNIKRIIKETAKGRGVKTETNTFPDAIREYFTDEESNEVIEKTNNILLKE